MIYSKIMANRIYKIDKNGKKKRVFFIFGLYISFKGDNSTVEIYEPIPKFINSKIRVGSNCNIKIGSTENRIKKLQIFSNNNSNVEIGENLNMTGGLEIHSGNQNCSIGKDCLFGKNIIIRCTDDHTILLNDKAVNICADVHIDEHVWLNQDVCILKGVKIAKNSVIGLRSIVTKNINEEGTVAVGIPARVIKKITTWKR